MENKNTAWKVYMERDIIANFTKISVWSYSIGLHYQFEDLGT